MIQTHKMKFKHEDTTLEVFYAFNMKQTGKRPLVLVAHDWSGRTDFAHDKAIKLAELGYVGFALDMYGEGKVGKTKEEKSALIQPFMEDRKHLQSRMLAGLEQAKKLDEVNPHKVGAIGFCFGGLCVLDLARSGADVTGVVSFHGLLGAPQMKEHPRIKAKILALHGHDDPMVPPDHVLAFEKEMTHAKADWQMHIFSNTMHGFTNPQANDPGFGTVFNPSADKRSWLLMKNFFEEIFTK